MKALIELRSKRAELDEQVKEIKVLEAELEPAARVEWLAAGHPKLDNFDVRTNTSKPPKDYEGSTKTQMMHIALRAYEEQHQEVLSQWEVLKHEHEESLEQDWIAEGAQVHITLAKKRTKA